MIHGGVCPLGASEQRRGERAARGGSVEITNKLMIKIVPCKCGKQWQIWRGNLGLREEEYSFHCTCGEHLVHWNKDSAKKTASSKKKLS
jgi:hypothetical protein